MSILDSIQAAEAKAEKAKVDANAKVEALLAETKVKANNAGAEKLKEAHEEEKKLAKEASAQLAKEEKALKAKYEKEIKDVASLADSRIDVAISYIMKKVVES